MLADIALAEELEDRLVDLMLDLGGYARIWRSASSVDARRLVRGATLDLAPGVETMSLVLSPEGWLVPLDRVADAAEGRLTERPWSSVETRFGPPESPFLLARILDELGRRFFPALEVRVDADAPGSSGTSPDELARLGARVRRALSAPSEHAPVTLTSDALGDFDRDGTEEEWDGLYRDRQRKLAWIGRTVDERRLEGAGYAEALAGAMRAVGITELPGDEPDEAREEDDEVRCPGSDFEAPVSFDADDEPHPLVRRATELGMRILDLNSEHASSRDGGPVAAASRAACELMGGTVQAMDPAPGPFGLRLVQLKRALVGAAHVRGGLVAAVATGEIAPGSGRSLQDELGAIERELQGRLRSTRASLA